VSWATIASLSPFLELTAAPEWRRIDFISDLHLASDLPRTFETWATYLLTTPADAVFILGDLFDAWIGDDVRHHGFEARCAEILARAARQRRIGFMVGNRDFLLGAAMLGECGMTPLPDPTVLRAFGQRVLLSHGDALCLSDTEYQRYRAQVRDPRWQAAALALPLDERRRMAAQMRHVSEQRNATGRQRPEIADIDVGAAVAWMDQAAAPVLVHGHTHRPGSQALAPGCLRHVLSDWDLDTRRDDPRAEVLRFTSTGFVRLTPTLAMQAVPPP